MTAPDALTVLRELDEKLDHTHEVWLKQAIGKDHDTVMSMIAGLALAQSHVTDLIARLEREQTEASYMQTLTERMRKLEPRVTPGDVEMAAEMVEDAERIASRRAETKERHLEREQADCDHVVAGCSAPLVCIKCMKAVP